MSEQPDWTKTVAAYEVPLPTPIDKIRFIQILTEEAERQGFHVDAATADELEVQSEISAITFNATVWRGEDDEEPMVSALDFKNRIGRVWLSFPLGQDPDRSFRFRQRLISKVEQAWPKTSRLPVMPNGSLPLTEDLVRTSDGYRVKPSAAGKYQSHFR